ncbi:MAG: 16S rRNA (cytidine(1402)-2'-O)-methyltransferase [Bacteroidales bacterium]|nr:16S rRNA (cytidine(1402)-2'-O)-methyltransferase [Bacteroidales bacterium]MCF8344987.1 16S rRNA (cytidine(1402)-2'-O)-methyltransferase [Bacteroidales bacterium]MCF8350456.1 16S rRNA (cytidine(1402)-2'-O)-methyltransferase [Bacteroidales bacterium]MCF8376205.1 16S rRNA (cytidine(1402)-2'-O)-methyltransferase [Bacteroidales bacterium]MCF8401129.1 16S rRNA (cytidine(1402)-2'-O)-methyltransferase [Bacteroidales bacterium]
MGKLYIIPTPIGNLGDITYRAVEVMKQLDLLLAEDTRKTGLLLKHYDITIKMKPHHQVNEHQTVSGIIDRLEKGENIGLVTDAGMPGISDPGFLLVRECLQAGIQIDCLPGPSAFLPALVLSGIPSDRFHFEGFLPHKKGRKTRLEILADYPHTLVFYESPHRLLKTLEQLAEHFGKNRYASVSRELSKMYEETRRGMLEELISFFSDQKPRGEFVIVVSGKTN